MGRSEWGIEITNQDDLDALRSLIDQHNILEISEDLELYSIITYQGHKYACLGNGGGRDQTSHFIENYRYKFHVVYYPFGKPDWWINGTESIWKAKSSDDPLPTNLFETPDPIQC